MSRFFNDTSAPEHKDAGTLGRALFDDQSFEDWSELYSTNTFSIFFVTTAFVGLLTKGSQEIPNYTSSVINITSISAIMKLAQNHVGIFPSLNAWLNPLMKPFEIVRLQQRESRSISFDEVALNGVRTQEGPSTG